MPYDSTSSVLSVLRATTLFRALYRVPNDLVLVTKHVSDVQIIIALKEHGSNVLPRKSGRVSDL